MKQGQDNGFQMPEDLFDGIIGHEEVREHLSP